MGALTPELGRLSHEFLGAVEGRGSVSLELLATGRYFDRLMDNSKVVRYLAHNFPANLTSFTACRRPASSHQFSSWRNAADLCPLPSLPTGECFHSTSESVHVSNRL
ncbi:hypothetical protein FJ492_11115 [Mesorhizobium sp. B2-5-4]|nr:hypothetical protein FJ434_11360 [Mesorhizobium sp. B2-5-13]TPK44936.1 hypothetical protein FJ492_11115 [Mesorhizobium sp. B2-5-4]TPK52415.1 hypothetical protein FJ560_06775 [Mesorhizobium sp. B2-5-5]